MSSDVTNWRMKSISGNDYDGFLSLDNHRKDGCLGLLK